METAHAMTTLYTAVLSEHLQIAWSKGYTKQILDLLQSVSKTNASEKVINLLKFSAAC